MKKKVLVLLCFAAAVLISALVAYKTWDSLDKIIELAIESYSSNILGAEVQIEKVQVNITEGQASLHGLHIANPDGYKTDYAMQLNLVKVRLDFESLASDVIVINEVMLERPSIIYEMASGGSNLDRLADNAQNQRRSANKKGNEGSSAGKKMIIENFLIRDGEVSVSHKILKGKSLTVAMPDIHLKDIRKDDSGASPAQVAEEIMDSVKSGVGVAAASLSLGETFESGVKGLKKGATGVGDKLKGIFK
jgi:hypothetical protein